MADHLQEEEQIDAIKQWWQENKVSVIGAIVLTLGGSFGWSQYQDYTSATAIAAADTYDEILLERASGESADQLAMLADTIRDENGSIAFAEFAALQVAAAAAEEGDFEQAQIELEKVMAGVEVDSTLGQLAQLRLAKVKAALGQEEAAIAILELGSDSFPVSYAQVLGDIHLAAGREAAALEAYQTAKAASLMLGGQSGLIDLKVSGLSLRTEQPVSEDAPQ
ncbi:tetratricopeptide repeat protein [Candidatus Paraluminiphilus aquimaris]|uniref:Ancillary SecYEG translocon subunit n=1 Tax=Candidatus Paraluminiphilus aquimaris TaxID=2518994 RepID=A0ABY6Q871_9GAMM|nr:tetratricopeptide repeat protein [Candidatus Paraluminiphilus aquimaris]UZP75225.1 tetratricopeptide repeat protein [Candidatus Paraluminiphilus aquimaris]